MAPLQWLAARVRSIHSVFHRLSLRARLLLGLVLLSLVGLVAADVVIYSEVGSYLQSQVGQELSLVQPHQLAVDRATGTITSYPFGGGSEPAGTLVEVFTFPISAGAAPLGSSSSSHNITLSAALVRTMREELAAAEAGQPGPLTPVTFTASGGGTSYRARAQVISLGYPAFGVLVVGIPLSGLEGTLLGVELAVTAAVLALLVAFGYPVVRLGMRPLQEIENTAGAIAAGDLSRRVEIDDPRTEVGRLGASLNEMLGQIEHAFSEQQASEERLRHFLADASHELRTPVTSIRGYAELFRRGAASRPEDLARAMRRIEDESIRMGVLVDDLLLLARLDRGRPLELVNVDLSAIVADCAADAQVQEPGREVTVELASPTMVRGDDARLRQVFANLLQNALRYSPVDSPVEVSLRHEGSTAIVSVTDHGVGIAPEHVPHVFDRFYRADPSRARDRGGSGLGLAIVASIVEAHGGTVEVISTPGVGSTFTVRLPLAGDEVTTVAREVSIPRATTSDATAPVWDIISVALEDEPAQGNSDTEVGVPGPL